MTSSTAPRPDAAPRRRLFHRKSPTAPLPRYTVSAERHDDALNVSWFTIARRLPRLSGIAVRLAWQAAPRVVLLTCLLQLITAAVTAIGLYATTSALTPLLASGATPERIGEALPALILVTVAACARSLVSALTVATTARIGPRVDGIAEARYLEATTRVPLAAYDDPAWSDQSEAASRAAKDAHQMIEALTSVTGAVLSIAAAAGILAHLHPVLLPLLLMAVLPRGFAAVRAARAAYLADRHTLADRRLRHSVIFETSSRDHALEVRAYTLRPWLLGRFRTVAARLEDAAAEVGRTTARHQLVGDAVAGCATVGVYAALLWLAATGRIAPAAAGTAFIAVQLSSRLLAGLVQGVNTTYKTGLYMADWDAFLTDTTTRTHLPEHPRPVPADPQVIEARNVTFHYPGSELPALQNVTVRVRRGEVLAIVGANGSGKSTLAKLLAGLYTPTTGTVTWDTTDISRTDPEQLWRRLAMLPQHFARWPVTARENIVLGQETGKETDILTAARAAGADTVLDSLPDGLNTNLAPSWWGGRDLSGGQWQRIATARAFYRDAPILICDEPTSALDPLAEEAVYRRIQALAKGRSVILITHRLGSTRTADRIIVLDGGTITEEGTHEALLARDGTYATMWRAQADTYTGDKV
ncbi:ABC transporter ATP-binding protein [Streptomyces calidiresistens]|uniref:ATP-binding cassette domain-containing protein n=1 Tax=Streptomyces calidiresistens TaxID=1485586 RepID=A0A7W3T0V0_9ACTN|nr:ABC transporter ATP-binding protein [Streptomyces calidiresistens]MBB0228551.1 ATP-binding cassette domain-containing protein [Streptomyces calidiresistens]